MRIKIRASYPKQNELTPFKDSKAVMQQKYKNIY